MPRYRISHPDLGRDEFINISGGLEEAAAEAARWISHALSRPAEEVAGELTVTKDPVLS